MNAIGAKEGKPGRENGKNCAYNTHHAFAGGKEVSAWSLGHHHIQPPVIVEISQTDPAGLSVHHAFIFQTNTRRVGGAKPVGCFVENKDVRIIEAAEHQTRALSICVP